MTANLHPPSVEDALRQGDAENFVMDLGPGYLGGSILPLLAVAEAYEAVLTELPTPALSYGPELGPRPAREAVAHLRGISAESVMITSGTSAALDMLAGVNKAHGSVVIVEAVSYDLATAVFHDHGYRIVRASENGADPVDGLEEVLRRHHEDAAFVYLTPTLANPSGRTMNTEQRERVIELAQQFNVQVIEDDAYADHLDKSLAYPSLARLGLTSETAEGRPLVLGLGSVSKVIGAGVRVGWLIAPPNWLKVLGSRGSFLSGGCVNQLGSLAISHLIETGDFAKQVQTVTLKLSERALSFRAGIAETSKGLLRPVRDWSGGLFDWIEAPVPSEVSATAESYGIRTFPGRRFGDDVRGHLRVSYGTVSPTQAREAGRQLGHLTEQSVVNLA